ncbi:MAG: type II secretion system protein GspE, partial [Candidatus Electrothrix sp. AUS4]|nr:type II secretion system protein GspE [Candidatus Electrothrix sp. AUS4]
MKPLGHILVDSFGLSEEEVEEAAALQVEKGKPLGEILLQQNKISAADLVQAIGQQYELEVRTELPPFPDPFFTDKVSIGFLKRFRMMPIATPDEAF